VPIKKKSICIWLEVFLHPLIALKIVFRFWVASIHWLNGPTMVRIASRLFIPFFYTIENVIQHFIKSASSAPFWKFLDANVIAIQR